MCQKSHSGSLPETPVPLSATPINKLFLQMAMPMVFGMVINGMYNLVDAFVVSRFIGNSAMAAVSIAFPLQMIIIALAATVSNGASVLVSQLLGAGQNSQANNVVTTAIRLVIFLAMAIIIFMLLSKSSLWRFLNVPAELQSAVSDYFMPLALGSICVFSLSLITDLLRAQGKMKALFSVILIGAMANIVLDVLFIIVFGWGITGAAMATLAAQLLACLVAAKSFIRPRASEQWSIRAGLFKTKIAKNILSLGAPVLFQYIGASIIIGLVNTMIAASLDHNTVKWLSAYGIIGRFNVFIILPLIAMTNASQTIISFNHGANNTERVQQALIQGLKANVSYLLIMASLLLGMPSILIGAFTNDTTVIELGQSIARMMFILLPLAGISAMLISYLQGIGKAKQALLLSLVKAYGLILPLLFIIQSFWGFEKLWYAFPVADLGAVIIASYIVIEIKTKNKRLVKETT